MYASRVKTQYRKVLFNYLKWNWKYCHFGCCVLASLLQRFTPFIDIIYYWSVFLFRRCSIQFLVWFSKCAIFVALRVDMFGWALCYNFRHIASNAWFWQAHPHHHHRYWFRLYYYHRHQRWAPDIMKYSTWKIKRRYKCNLFST